MIDWNLAGKLVYDGVLLFCLVAVIKAGGRDERVGIAIVIVAGGATALNPPLSAFFRAHGRYGLFAIDLCALVAFDALMVRSRSFWPIWATGIQLAAVFLDLAKILTVTSKSHLWVQGKFAYLLLLCIVIGTAVRARRPKKL